MPVKPEDLRAAGDWVVQLKGVLGKGADFGGRPDSEHRSTKKAVRLMLTNLREGVGDQNKALNVPELRTRSGKLLLNAIDLLMDDKTARSKKGKTRLQALEK